MLSLNKLEKVIELEEQLRTEYQDQLDAKTKEIEALTRAQAELQATVDSQKATIEMQLETITDLSSKTTANQKIEQQHRELGNRSEKQQEEISELKKRLKGLQRDLGEVRDENKTLTQFDPARMKKNLDASKKKLVEKTKAADLLQKSLNKSKGENAELERKVKEMEAKLAELEPEEDIEETTEEAAEEAAA